jgi:diguanylate cyclase (GGDEF)-like protein/PAS domain S-box-containing protein
MGQTWRLVSTKVPVCRVVWVGHPRSGGELKCGWNGVYLMFSLSGNQLRTNDHAGASRRGAAHRCQPLRVLFVHRDAEEVDSCVQALKRAEFAVQADIVLTLGQCVEQLGKEPFDLIVAEYPSPNWNGSQALEVLQQVAQSVPLIFVAASLRNECKAALRANGAYDFIEPTRMEHLPMAVRGALEEKKLREELALAERTRERAEARYRALVDNPTYGICRVDAEGRFSYANGAFLTMLGYTSREEFLEADFAKDVIRDPAVRDRWSECVKAGAEIESFEMECHRKDDRKVKVRLSGRGVYTSSGAFDGYEIIVGDVTEQQAREGRLREQAESDSLTGLANHRRLFEVLHTEISRSKRTGREFALMLLDVDQFKRINDQYGHLVGDRALCRLTNALRSCCRSIDTAARQGGDEFALVLPETSAADAALVGERICEILAKDLEEPALSVSVGVAAYPRDAESVGPLLYAADAALYGMKGKRIHFVSAGVALQPSSNTQRREMGKSAG